ncbi:serine hydrolase domain-containing protein [Paenibacillus shenyangensis]|uniref:serine hydrolase domain-containing protein n=1 Tax=Paenibacillus sp. A9 TaxID=1284352 RepID=UPI00037CBB41|nr:serine hydrolase domain-containing protein [Paenibacillus sp. A9]
MTESVPSVLTKYHTHSAIEPLSSDQLDQLERIWNPLHLACQQRIIPSASAAIYWRGHCWYKAVGWAVDTDHMQIAADTHTVYDCASLTKVTVTLPLILTLVEHGMLELDRPISAYLTEFQTGPHQQITLRQLLSHTSGLPAIADFHSSAALTLPEAIQTISQMPPAYEAGQARMYSDPGFIVLGELFTRISGLQLTAGAEQYIWKPLHMEQSTFVPGPSHAATMAATEYDNQTESYLQGIVHDENARALGGMCGHAGLFATASDLLRYAQYWLEAVHTPRMQSPANLFIAPIPPLSLSKRLLHEAVTRQTPLLPGTRRGLGWVLQGDEADVSGPILSAAAFGHTGFTGTSIQIDPSQQLAIVLLTNRVHYGRTQSIQQLRRDFHTAVASALNHLPAQPSSY